MKARIHKPTTAAIRRLAGVLRRGGVVAAPTETVYGLAGNALDPAACEKIFRAKGRPSTDPLIVHVLNAKAAGQVAMLNDAARALGHAFWPGPLTLVLPKKAVVPSLVTAGLPSVAVRVPRHPVFRALLREAGLPLAAPSANPFGYISPTTAEHVRDHLGKKIGHILDGGACRIGVESTIVDLRDPRRPRMLRPGWITREQIEAVLQVRVLGYRRSNGKSSARPRTAKAELAPGMLERHYSPRTPLTLVKRIRTRDVLAAGPESGKTAYLFFAKPNDARVLRAGSHVQWLSEDGDPAEVARSLFGKLRTLDTAGFRKIVAESAPTSPEGRALNDRLRRAAAKR